MNHMTMRFACHTYLVPARRWPATYAIKSDVNSATGAFVTAWDLSVAIFIMLNISVAMD